MNDKSNTDNNIIQPYQTFFDTSNMKLHQAMLCLQKSSLLLTQIQQKCSNKKQLYIPQNYSTIQYFSAEQIDDFKAKGVSHLIQNDTTYFRPDLPKNGVLVQARYCLDLEDLLQNYLATCAINVNYPTEVDDLIVLERCRQQDSISYDNIKLLLRTYEHHYTTISRQIHQEINSAEDSADVLFNNTTELEGYLVTLGKMMDISMIQERMLEPTQENLFDIPYIGDLDTSELDPNECDSTEELFKNIGMLYDQNKAFLTYVEKMKTKFIALEDETYTLEVLTVQEIHEEQVHSEEKRLVETRHIQIGNIVTRKSISRWSRFLAASFCTSHCNGVGGKPLSQFYDNVLDMHECNNSIYACLNDTLMPYDESRYGYMYAIRLHGHAEKLNFALRYVCERMNIKSYVRNY